MNIMHEKFAEFISGMGSDLDVMFYDANADFPDGCLIVGGWEEISIIHERWNSAYNPEEWAEFKPYYEEKGEIDCFSDLRLSFIGHRPYYATHPLAKSPYLVPDGLDTLDDLVTLGFEDDTKICCVCGPIGRESFSALVYEDIYCKLHTNACDYLESRINQPRLTINESFLDSIDGWSQVPIEFENGLYGGQTDSPETIINILTHSNIDGFFVAEASQFMIEFSVWVRTEDLARATSILEAAHKAGDLYQGYDMATEFEKVLRGGSSPYIIVSHLGEQP